MRNILLYLLVACCYLSNIVVISGESVNLTETTFNQQLGAHKTMVVLFYAPWCSHSKAALPIWEEMAESMAQSSQDKDIFVGKVDCVEHPDVYWKQNVESFPTIKAFVNHNALPIVYDGERVANTMWRYFRMMHQQYVEEISTMEEFSALQERKLTAAKPLVLALFPSEEEQDGTSTTESTESINIELNNKVDGACKDADRVTCVITRNPAFATGLGLDLQAPSITVFSMFGGDALDIPATRPHLDSMTGAELAQWLQDSSFPPLVALTTENENLIFSNRRRGYENHILVLVPDADSAEGRTLLANLRAVGRRLQGQCVLIYVQMKDISSYAKTVLEDLRIGTTSAQDAEEEDGEGQWKAMATMHAVRSKKSALHFYHATTTAATATNAAARGRHIDLLSGVHVASDQAQQAVIESWVTGVLDGTVTPSRSSSFDQGGDKDGDGGEEQQ